VLALGGIAARRVRDRVAMCDVWRIRERGTLAGFMMDRMGFRVWVVILSLRVLLDRT